MKIKTQGPLVIIGPNDQTDAETFLYLDGKSSKSQVAAFQQWVISVKDVDLGGKADGKFGPKTKAAWKKYGAEFTKATGGAVSNEPADSSRSGETKEKIKNTVNKIGAAAKEYGVLDLLASKLGFGQSQQQPSSGPEVMGGGDQQPPAPPEKQSSEKGPMSTTNIILIGVGAVLTVSAIIYFANRSKKSK